MTITSEITRLQNAKSNIITAIENKWVWVPSSAKLDWLNTYINNIQNKDPVSDIFIPKSFTVNDAIYNTNWCRMWDQWLDIVTADWNTYYHFFEFEPWTSSWYNHCLYYVKKSKWEDMVVWSVAWEVYESSSSSYMRWWLWWFRLKLWSNWTPICSMLLSQYYYPWTKQPNNRTWRCINYWNNEWVVNLWTQDVWWDYDAIEPLRTASCWITADESVVKNLKTEISTPSSSTKNRYHVVATIK